MFERISCKCLCHMQHHLRSDYAPAENTHRFVHYTYF